jgi:hypothetical protein
MSILGTFITARLLHCLFAAFAVLVLASCPVLLSIVPCSGKKISVLDLD